MTTQGLRSASDKVQTEETTGQVCAGSHHPTLRGSSTSRALARYVYFPLHRLHEGIAAVKIRVYCFLLLTYLPCVLTFLRKLRATLHGSGMVNRQYPAPGTAVEEVGDGMQLWLGVGPGESGR